jgi:RNA-binding protein
MGRRLRASDAGRRAGSAETAVYNAAMTTLTEKQRRHLRGLGHSLKPIIFIGKAGMSAGVIAETAQALQDHELIKVRVTGMERDERDEALDTLAQKTGSEIVGRIGHVATLYRRNPERQRIVIPG